LSALASKGVFVPSTPARQRSPFPPMSDLSRFEKPCTYTACPKLTTRKDGRCEEHPRPFFRRKPREDKRPSASERGYNWTWYKLRNSYLKKNPLCEHCLKEGITKPASEVDHIIALVDGGARLDANNLQSLCFQHHRLKTRQDAIKRVNSPPKPDVLFATIPEKE